MSGRWRSFMAAAYAIAVMLNVAFAIEERREIAALVNWMLAMVMLWWFIDEVRDIVRDDRAQPFVTITGTAQARQIAEAIRRHNARGGAS